MNEEKRIKNEAEEALDEEKLEKVCGGLNPFKTVERVENAEYDDEVQKNI